MVAKYPSTQSPDNWIWVQWSPDWYHGWYNSTHMWWKVQWRAHTVEQKWVQWSPDCCLSSVVMVNTLPKLFLIKSVSPNDNVTLATVSKLKCIPIATSPLHPTTTHLQLFWLHTRLLKSYIYDASQSVCKLDWPVNQGQTINGFNGTAMKVKVPLCGGKG